MTYKIYAQIWKPIKGDSRGTIEEMEIAISADNDAEAAEKLLTSEPTTEYARFDMPDFNDVICEGRRVGIDFHES